MDSYNDELKFLSEKMDALDKQDEKAKKIYLITCLSIVAPLVICSIYLMVMTDSAGYPIPELFSLGFIIIIFCPVVWGGIVIIYSLERMTQKKSLESKFEYTKTHLIALQNEFVDDPDLGND